MWLCPLQCPTQDQGTLGTDGPGPFVQASGHRALLMASPPPPPPGQPHKSPPGPAEIPLPGPGCGCGWREDAGDAQPFLSQYILNFYPPCMAMGEICFARFAPPLQTAPCSPNPSLFLGSAWPHGTSPGAACASLGTSHLTPPCTSGHRAGSIPHPKTTQWG